MPSPSSSCSRASTAEGPWPRVHRTQALLQDHHYHHVHQGAVTTQHKHHKPKFCLVPAMVLEVVLSMVRIDESYAPRRAMGMAREEGKMRCDSSSPERVRVGDGPGSDDNINPVHLSEVEGRKEGGHDRGVRSGIDSIISLN
jgi:hypothetical protein